MAKTIILRLRASRWAGAFFLSLLAIQPALAANTDVEFEKAGLYGWWAVDCSRAPAPGNAIVTVQRDGPDKVTWTTDPGDPAYRSVYRIEYLGTSERGSISFRATGIDGREKDSVIELVFAVEPDQIRAIEAKHSRNGILIRDGIRTGDGRSNPWLHRCPGVRLS